MALAAHVATFEQSFVSPLIAKVQAALQEALAGIGKLEPAVLALGGMSGKKYRLFINNLIGALPDARYLEVGVWAGSTLCSAIYKNAVTAVAIDNWAEFGGPKQTFLQNLGRFASSAAQVKFIESDFRAVDYKTLGRFNVYLFDGPHSSDDQRDGVLLAQPALDNQFVLIVDDWNWQKVRSGTLDALRSASLTIDYKAEIRTSLDDSHGPEHGEKSDWHNGYFIAVLSKTIGRV